MSRGIFFAHRKSEAMAISNSIKEYGFGADVHRIEDYIRRYEFLPRISKIRKAVERANFVITDDVFTIPFTLKLLGSKVPIVYRARGDYRREVDLRGDKGTFSGPARHISGKIMGTLFERFADLSLIIPVCNHLAVNLSHLNADKIVTVYNGVDLHRFNPDRVAQESRLAGDIERKKIGIIFNFDISGKVAPLKMILDVFKSLLMIENMVLLIAGDGIFRAQIEKTVRDSGLDENVRFLGFIEKIEEFISACDVIWHPSYLDELPTSILECMAMEKAVISFDTGGIPEIITHLDDGFLVPRNDCDKFKEYTVQLFKDEKLKQKIEKNAREKIELKFNWKFIGKKFSKCLEEI